MFGLFKHSGLDVALHFCGVAAQNLFAGGNILVVVVPSLFPDTRRSTIADMVFEAEIVFSTFNALFRHWRAARPWPIKFVAEFEQCIHCWDVTVRAKECRALAHPLPNLEDAWQILVADGDGRVGLIVL